MTIKNPRKKGDTREVDYNQAIVQLGLQKAELEREIDKTKRELKEISVSYELVRSAHTKKWEGLDEESKKKISDHQADILDFEKQIAIKRNILTGLEKKYTELGDGIKNLEEKITKHEANIAALDEKKLKAEKEVEKLEAIISNKKNEANTAREISKSAAKELEAIQMKLRDAMATKIDVEAETEKAHRNLKELNEIISVLQSTNKQGLDLVASFEGERKRLREKEEFLLRKETDLGIYEKRVEKMRQEAGINIEMKFQ